jgi:hypothetical protein
MPLPYMVVASYTCTGLYKTIPAVAGRSSGVAHATCMPARGLISPSGVPGDAGHVIPLAPPPLSMRLRCSDAACSVFRRGGNDMTSRGVLEFFVAYAICRMRHCREAILVVSFGP